VATGKTVKRTIVRIDEELCDGCGACVAPCAEGPIQLVDGKAKVMRCGANSGGQSCPPRNVRHVRKPFARRVPVRQAQGRLRPAAQVSVVVLVRLVAFPGHQEQA